MKITIGLLIFISTCSFSQSRPTEAFFSLIEKLESQGYSSDSLRAKKVYSELKQKNTTIIDDKTFYKLNPNESRIITANLIDKYLESEESLNLFKNAEDVWVYFYSSQTKSKDNYIEDGIIEQWEFNSKETATTAINKLNSVYPMPFFNTQPYYVQSGNILYVFHTRADMFSYKQKEFFNLFKELLK